MSRTAHAVRGDGVNRQGRKELLGLWLSETEGAKFWLACLTDGNNRAAAVLIVCGDGRTGFPLAIRTAFPQATVRLCIVHLVRAASRCAGDKDRRAVAADLKAVDAAATAPEAGRGSDRFGDVCGETYPTVVRPWRARWPDLVAMFAFPATISRAVDTTNGIESVSSVIRKFTRNRKRYPNAESAWNLVYPASHDASKKWTMSIVWGKSALNHVATGFEGRVPQNAVTGPPTPSPRFPPALTRKD